MPLFTSRLANGLSTPITVQNLSGGTIAAGGIQLTCKADAGNTVPPTTLNTSNTTAVANNTPYFFNPVVDTTTFPTAWFGSCRITASGNAVSFMQMRFVGTSTSNAAAYEAINASGTARVISFPRVAERMADGFATAATIQNPSLSNPAHVVLNYTANCSSYSSVVVAHEIPAGGSLIRNHRLPGTDGLPDGWCGSLTVTSSDQPIDGFIQLTNINNPPGDSFMAHNAIVRP